MTFFVIYRCYFKVIKVAFVLGNCFLFGSELAIVLGNSFMFGGELAIVLGNCFIFSGELASIVLIIKYFQEFFTIILRHKSIMRVIHISSVSDGINW